MNKITKTLSPVDVSAGKRTEFLERVHVSRTDKNITTVTVPLLDNGAAYAPGTGLTATARCRKPDNTYCDVTATVSGSNVSFTVSDTMTQKACAMQCDILLVDVDGNRKVIPACLLDVGRVVDIDGAEESSSEFSALTDLLATLNATVTTTYVANAISEALASYTQSTDLTTAISEALARYTQSSDLSAVISSAILARHPVGSYVILNTTSDPNVYIGGTWVKESEGYVLGTAGTSKTVNSTAGSDTHTNTIEEMPAHTHTFRAIPHVNNLVRIEPSDTFGASAEATITTNSTGNGSSWDIRQRTKYVYFWKRTA